MAMGFYFAFDWDENLEYLLLDCDKFYPIFSTI